MWHPDDPIIWDEFNLTINGLKSIKLARLNGMPPKVFKAMYKDCRRYVFYFINYFCHDRSDFESWHKIQCITVPQV